MSAVNIQFKLTSGGVNEAFYKASQTLDLNITHAQIGSGNRTPNGNESALVAPVEYAAISAHFEVSNDQHRIAAVFPGNSNVFNISEIGLWSGIPGDPGSVLVFYFSQAFGHVAVKSLNVDFNFENDLFFSGVVPSNITIVADTQFNALAMLVAHEAADDPHIKYATKAGVQAGDYSTSVASGTANAISAAFSPAITSLTGFDGGSLFVRSGFANTSQSVTFTPNSGVISAKSIVKGNDLALAVGDIPGSGYWMELRYDSGFDKWVLLNPATGVVGSSNGTKSVYKNLSASATGLSSLLTVSYDSLTLIDDSSGYSIVDRDFSGTVNTANTGANGLDTGTIDVNKWYFVFRIAKQDGTKAWLFSLSPSAPTMPSGYTLKAYAFAFRTDNTANKFPKSFIKKDSRSTYKVATGSNVPVLPVMASGVIGSYSPSTPTWAALSVVDFVPSFAGAPIAKRILVSIATQYNGGGPSDIAMAPNNSYGGSVSSNPPPFQAQGSSTPNFYQIIPCDVLLESANIYAVSNVSGGGVLCYGWEE